MLSHKAVPQPSAKHDHSAALPKSRERKGADAECLLQVDVDAIMTPIDQALVVPAEMDLEALTSVLLESGRTCVAVKDSRGAVVGFVSMADLVRERWMNGDAEEDPSPKEHARPNVWGFHLRADPHTTVRSVMMPFLISIDRGSPIEYAAAMMAFEGVHRLLVRSPTREVVGIVSALEVLRWQARRAGYLVPRRTLRAWRRHCEYAI